MDVRIWEGEVYIADDFDDLPAEFMEAFIGNFDTPLAQ